MAHYIFKGPSSYEEKDKEFFLGREEETKDLLYLVEHNDFSVCYAESGEGKSSLINAGLYPLLKEHFFLPINIRFDFNGKEEFQNSVSDYLDDYVWSKIKQAIEGVQEKTETFSNLTMRNVLFDEESNKDKETLWWKLRANELRINELRFNTAEIVIPVLIFDQFEEVFTLSKDTNWIFDFFKWLENLYNDENLESGRTFSKRFKVLLSLRSEYVSELDYWSMNKCFIPSLKNNRYCLKPLMKTAALKVAKQLVDLPSGIDYEDIIKYAKTERSGEWECITEGLPCVSALVLSLILTSLAEKDKDVEKKLENFQESNKDDRGKAFFDFLLEHIYEKTLTECNINDDKETKDFIESLEQSLVDVNGRRRHISEKDLPLISDKKRETLLNILTKGRIINIIDHHYEISHDSLCPIFLKKNNKRRIEREQQRLQEIAIKAEKARKDAEEAIQRENQRANYTSSFFLLMALTCIVWFVSSIFQNKSSFWALQICDASGSINALGQFFFFYILVNMAIIPLLIYSIIKKMKITSWLSIYGVISNVILMFFFIAGQEKGMNLRWAIAAVSIGVPLITLYYSYRFHLFGKTNKAELKTIASSIPLLVFFLVLSSYLFYLCVFNKTIGLPEPIDSCWGLLVIPLLAFEIIKNMFNLRRELSGIIVILLLGILAYNNSTLPFTFSYITVGIVLITILALYAWLFRTLHLIKRICSTVALWLIVVSVYIINVGYNLSTIDYSSVTHVSNWLDVRVVDDKIHHGILNACTGDTIVPCQLDSIKKEYCYIESDALKYDNYVSDPWGFFSSSNGHSQFKCLYYPLTELYIYRRCSWQENNTTRADSIMVLAAKTYSELRKANISYLRTGERYSLDDITSFRELYNLQREELCTLLRGMARKREVSSIISSLIPQNDNEKIDGKFVSDLNRNFARTFYLCMLKDRIIQRDSINIFMLAEEILPLYFYDASDISMGLNINTNINIGGVNLSYRSNIATSELKEGSINAWYDFANALMALDMNFNQESFKQARKKQIDKATKVIEDRHLLLKELNKNKENKFVLDTPSDIIRAYNQTLKVFQQANDIIDDTKSMISDIVDSIGSERLQMDIEFQTMINDMFESLSSGVLGSQNVYNSVFVNLCQDLYVVAALRQYETSDMLNELENMNSANSQIFKQYRNLQNLMESKKKEIRDELNKLSRDGY